MKSPVGSRKPLQSVALEAGLVAFRCVDSGGHYIPANSYMLWLSRQPARLPQLAPLIEQSPMPKESKAAYICPETGTIMTRYKVGHDFQFSIDRSITGGIWLDGGEWEDLKKRNFHDELHFVFTEPWQNQILKDKAQREERERLKARLGPAMLERVESLKTELADHPYRAQVLAFLMNE